MIKVFIRKCQIITLLEHSTLAFKDFLVLPCLNSSIFPVRIIRAEDLKKIQIWPSLFHCLSVHSAGIIFKYKCQIFIEWQLIQCQIDYILVLQWLRISIFLCLNLLSVCAVMFSWKRFSSATDVGSPNWSESIDVCNELSRTSSSSDHFSD